MRFAGFAVSSTTLSHRDDLSKPRQARECGTVPAQPVCPVLIFTGSFLVTFAKVFSKSNFKSQQRFDFSFFVINNLSI